MASLEDATRVLHAFVARQSSGSSQTDSSNTNSVSSFVSTLVPAFLIALAFTAVFVFLRPKLRYLYSPRTFASTLGPNERTEFGRPGFMGWLKDSFSSSGDYLFNHQTLDAYLYSRYIKMCMVIMFVGALITWPVLFPVNATGGGGQSGFDLISFANVQGSARYFAHAGCAWIFLGFVMFVITRETIHYIAIRQAYLLSTWNASRISQRTVLFTFVPESYLNLENLRTLFPASQRVWIAPSVDELQDQVDERNKLALKLEAAEIKLSKNAIKRRTKAEKKEKKAKKGEADVEAATAPPASAEIDEQYLLPKDRPTHRLKKMKLPIGSKVDTIDYNRSQLANIVPEVQEGQQKVVEGRATHSAAVLIEFRDMYAAGAAFAMVNHSRPGQLVGRQIGVLPNEVIWKNLKFGYWQSTLRYIVATTVIVLMIMFWSIPVAIVGIISNVNYLTSEVPFLSFIDSIPKVILGVVTGLLPTILLAVLMSLVSVFCRFMAKQGGAVTTSEVEMQTQQWYFAFQFIQVFLLTTITSGATSVAAQIVKNPTSAISLLANNLPKASNFYNSYFALQGLAIASKALLNIGGIVKVFIARLTGSTPRAQFGNNTKLSDMQFGSIYPVYACLALIPIAYSCIAPLMLGFATVAFALIYLAFRYNILFTYDPTIDTKGAAYARALQHLTFGIYLSEICLIGLFAIKIGDSPISVGPLILVILLLGVTVAWHVLVRSWLHPLTQHLPRDRLLENTTRIDLENGTNHHNEKLAHQDSVHDGTHASLDGVGNGANNGATKGPQTTSASYDTATHSKSGRVKNFFHLNVSAELVSSRFAPFMHQTQDAYPEEIMREAYLHPAVTSKTPTLWLARDNMGISQREVRDTREATNGHVNITDDGAFYTEKGSVKVTEQDWTQAPLWEGRYKY